MRCVVLWAGVLLLISLSAAQLVALHFTHSVAGAIAPHLPREGGKARDPHKGRRVFGCILWPLQRHGGAIFCREREGEAEMTETERGQKKETGSPQRLWSIFVAQVSEANGPARSEHSKTPCTSCSGSGTCEQGRQVQQFAGAAIVVDCVTDSSVHPKLPMTRPYMKIVRPAVDFTAS